MSSELKAPIHLWREVRALICDIHALFGAPETIAALHTLTAATHRELSRWVRCLEAFVRRLLLIEAATLLETLTPTRKRAPRVKARQKHLIEHDPDKPEEWRVCFRAFSSPVYGGSGSRVARDEGGGVTPSGRFATTSPVNGGGKCPRLFSAWPLAERCEALLRVFNDPMPYARRLARKLRKQLSAFVAMARRAVNVHGVFSQSAFDEAQHFALAALPLDTS